MEERGFQNIDPCPCITADINTPGPRIYARIVFYIFHCHFNNEVSYCCRGSKVMSLQAWWKSSCWLKWPNTCRHTWLMRAGPQMMCEDSPINWYLHVTHTCIWSWAELGEHSDSHPPWSSYVRCFLLKWGRPAYKCVYSTIYRFFT